MKYSSDAVWAVSYVSMVLGPMTESYEKTGDIYWSNEDHKPTALLEFKENGTMKEFNVFIENVSARHWNELCGFFSHQDILVNELFAPSEDVARAIELADT